MDIKSSELTKCRGTGVKHERVGQSGAEEGNKNKEERVGKYIQVHETVMMFSQGKTKDGAQSHASVSALRLNNV